MKILHSLLALGTVAAAGTIARSLGVLNLDGILGAVGLSRRRSHALENVALIAVAATVGAGAALLLAPKSGAETRETVRKEAQRLGDAATAALRPEDKPSPSVGAGTGNDHRPSAFLKQT